jgi:hypothetical protein
MYIHVSCQDGEAKFWIEPVIALADYCGLTTKQLKELHKIVEDRTDEIIKAWKKHFGC